MTDTSTSDQTPKPTPEEKKHHRFVMFIIRFPSHIHKALIVASWVFPVVLIGLGYLIFPSLRGYVGWSVPDAIAWGLFMQLALMVGYLAWEWYYVSNRNTGVLELQYDAVVTTAEALILTALFAFLLTEGVLWWAFPIPWIGSMADAFLTSALGINNAAQKPGFPLKVGT